MPTSPVLVHDFRSPVKTEQNAETERELFDSMADTEAIERKAWDVNNVLIKKEVEDMKDVQPVVVARVAPGW